MVVFAAAALIMVGGAIVGTPQATVMMASAPADLGGAVAGVKSAANEAGFALGPTVFALVGVNVFLGSVTHELARSGITREDVNDAMQMTQGGRAAHLVNPEYARLMVEHGPHNMVDAIQTLSFILAAGPIASILLALWLVQPQGTVSGPAH